MLGLLTLPQPCLCSLGCRCHSHLCCCRHQAGRTCWAGPVAASIRPEFILGVFRQPRGQAQPSAPWVGGHGGHTSRQTHPWRLRQGCTRLVPPTEQGETHAHTPGSAHCGAPAPGAPSPGRARASPPPRDPGPPFPPAQEGSPRRAILLAQGPSGLRLGPGEAGDRLAGRGRDCPSAGSSGRSHGGGSLVRPGAGAAGRPHRLTDAAAQLGPAFPPRATHRLGGWTTRASQV